jgi:hypothetical protein
VPVLSGGQLTISWSGPGTLQESTDLENWTDVIGNPSNGFQINPAHQQMFYRLK